MRPAASAKAGPGRLRIFPHDKPVQELWLIEPRAYTVGRDQNSDLCLDDPVISRSHLEIDTRQEPWQIVDPGSKNGTRIDGRPLGQGTLEADCWISLGGIPARFERLTADRKQQTDYLNQQHRDTLNVALDHLHQESDIARQFDRLCEAFLELAGCTHGALILAANASETRVAWIRGWNQFSGSRTVLRSALVKGEVVVVNDVTLEQSMASQASIVNRPVRAVICIPLKSDEQVLGALYAESDQPGKLFSRLDVELMETLAEQAVILIGLKRLRTQLYALASENG